jgi:hypothetical protein
MEDWFDDSCVTSLLESTRKDWLTTHFLAPARELYDGYHENYLNRVRLYRICTNVCQIRVSRSSFTPMPTRALCFRNILLIWILLVCAISAKAQ